MSENVNMLKSFSPEWHEDELKSTPLKKKKLLLCLRQCILRCLGSGMKTSLVFLTTVLVVTVSFIFVIVSLNLSNSFFFAKVSFLLSSQSFLYSSICINKHNKPIIKLKMTTKLREAFKKNLPT